MDTGANDFVDQVRNEYPEDVFFSKVLGNTKSYQTFTEDKGLIYTRNHTDQEVLCIPRVLHPKSGRRLTEMVIDNSHMMLRYLRIQHTTDHVRRYYWW
ncbi:hypothetical protein K488DRAFT_63408, partial [Vararia minispora EC-137]